MADDVAPGTSRIVGDGAFCGACRGERPPRCGAVAPDGSGLACDRAPDHPGDHRAYRDQQDVVVFWPPQRFVEAGIPSEPAPWSLAVAPPEEPGR